MGVAVSSESALSPISLASTIIGFISFGFTLATLFRVFWDNIETFFSAATEINDMLTNLRQSLYEERSNLRRARQTLRRRRMSAVENGKAEREYLATGGSHREGLTPEDAIQAMSAAVKDMIKSFKTYEKPFLEKGLREPRRRRSDKEDALGYSSGGLGEDEHADYLYKSKVQGLMEAIMRIEIRRIGYQTSHISFQMREMIRDYDDFQDRLDGIDRMEQRLSRIVGVRRVD